MEVYMADNDVTPIRIAPGQVVDDYAPLMLSAASSEWRHVARSTPRIWTSLWLLLEEPKRPRKKKNTQKGKGTWIKSVLNEMNQKEDTWMKKIELLRYYFERAKSLPLALAFGTYNGFKADRYKTILEVALKCYLSLDGPEIPNPDLFSGVTEDDSLDDDFDGLDIEMNSGRIIVQMLQERLLSSTDIRSTEALRRDPFVLALPFDYHDSPEDIRKWTRIFYQSRRGPPLKYYDLPTLYK